MSEIEFPQLYFDTYIFSQWLIESLHNSKLSIQEIAQLSGVSDHYINLLVEGDDSDLELTQPRLEFIDKLAEIMNIDINEARSKAGFSLKYINLRMSVKGSGNVTFNPKINNNEIIEIAKGFNLVYDRRLKLNKQDLEDFCKSLYEEYLGKRGQIINILDTEE
jgi:transcriptional regulator with XRE-family HTH domain